MESTNPHSLEDSVDGLHEESYGCAFSCFPCPLRRRRRGLQHRPLLRGEQRQEETWWQESARRAKKLLGSPPDGAKCRALLHRLGGGRWSGAGKKRRGAQFQYDHTSYALNFDDGAGREEAKRTFLEFAARPPPSPASSRLLPQRDSCI